MGIQGILKPAGVEGRRDADGGLDQESQAKSSAKIVIIKTTQVRRLIQ